MKQNRANDSTQNNRHLRKSGGHKKKNGGRSNSYMWILAVVALLIAFAYITVDFTEFLSIKHNNGGSSSTTPTQTDFVQQSNDQKQANLDTNIESPRTQELWQYNIIGEVPRIPFDSLSMDLADIVQKYNSPIVLTGVLDSITWNLKHWTPEYIKEKCGDISFLMKKRSNPLFTYTEAKPLVDLPEWTGYVRPESTIGLTIREFWNLVNESARKQTEPESYLYFTGYLARSEDDNQEFPCLSNDIEPPWLLSFGEEFNTNLWLGSAHVIAQTHYDESPNFNLQVYGHKRWLLSPPEEAHKIYTFPYLFPAYRQSQVDFVSKTQSASIIHDMLDDRYRYLLYKERARPLFPLLSNITAYEVVMNPGELLYIPPYYFHRVITEDISIAINTWSEPAGGGVHTRLSRLPLPLELHWPLHHRANAASIYLQQLARALSADDPQYWFDVVTEQYRALYDSIDYKPSSLDEMQQILKCDESQKEDAELSHTLQELTQRLNEKPYVANFVAELRKLASIGAQRLIFSAYCEQVAEAVLPTEFIPTFIMRCLPHNQK